MWNKFSESSIPFLKRKKTQVSRWDMKKGITIKSNGKEIGTDIIQEHNVDHSLTSSQASNRTAMEDKLEGKVMKQGENDSIETILLIEKLSLK